METLADYPKIETEAKAMAEELGISHLWNDIEFRDATKDDENMIQATLDSEEAIPKNGDWAVKLGINLFYSANLSRSPLYSKQMPYNSVIYDAFGRSSPASSSARSDGFERRPAKQKKVVAGKWCGKVWMSSQVHPFLAKNDPEEEEQERSFHTWATPDEKVESKYDGTRKSSNTMIAKKYVRKRKMTVESSSTKKAKRVKREDAVSDNSMDDSHENHRRSLRSKQAVSIGGGSAKKAKHTEIEGAASDDSLHDNSHRQHRRTLKSKQATYVESDDIVSDDSLEVDFRYQHKKILRSKPSKHAGREDVVSDDSLDSDSHQLRGRVCRIKQAKHTEEEDVVSDDSLDSDSQLHRRIPRSKQAKYNEREDSSSDYFHGNNLQKLQRRISKSKPAKSIGREDEDLDEPLEDNARKSDERILRSKRTKSALQQKMKKESPHHAKQSTARPVKQENRKLKQQTPHLRNSQCEQNILGSCAEEELEGGPSTRLRKRNPKPQKLTGAKRKEQQQPSRKKVKSAVVVKAQAGHNDAKSKDEEGEYMCDIEGCTMSFSTKQELVLHKKNICPVKGCGKKFFSHKYLVQHRRVHMDDRPLRCPWKGCKMTFKWAWARTEHIRVHTGARPYVCAEPGCGQTFRFVSDFSRHKRKTGHSVKKAR